MTRPLLVLLLAAWTGPAVAQMLSRHVETFPDALGFETGADASMPRGWTGGPRDTLSVDGTTAHSGAASGRIDRDAQSDGSFSSLTAILPIDFAGAKLTVRAFVKTENALGRVGLWMREDGRAGTLEFHNNQGEIALQGSRDWQAYSIELPLAAEARELLFGVMLDGPGTVWVDDVTLYVDGQPVETAARVEPVLSGWEQDREFDGGSGISIDALNATQMENLVVLAKVWGFLKYHHPRVARGDFNWDYELFRVLPDVLAAADAAERNGVLLGWARRIGKPQRCERCAAPPEDARLLPDLAWIRDEALLGADLAAYLELVHRNRPLAKKQFYVSTQPRVGNPAFEHELEYSGRELDDGQRLLALFRYWNIVEYWFPYRDVVGRPWDDVLRDRLPVFLRADSFEDYLLALYPLIGAVHDTHAQVYSHDAMLPPRGECWLPAAMRFIGTEAVAAKLLAGGSGALEVGDVLLELDGSPVSELVDAWRPYYSASNEATLLRNMARSMTRGPCGPVDLRVRRDGEVLGVHAARVRLAAPDRRVLALSVRDRPGDTFQWLADDVAYLKLSTIDADDVQRYMEEAQHARGLIVDIRNYPNDYVTYVLGGYLVTEPTDFAAFTVPDLGNPGAFTWANRGTLQPHSPHFAGKVVVLVDESSQSNAEFTAMALRAGGNTTVVGSTTAGADGNVSWIALPGGVHTAFSGIGVFYPDGTPTQRVGIVPDIVVTPTAEGIRAGRDEVLERALREITGPEE